jgi:glycosyltransferase involved in cell wall biosynthesis
MNWWIFLAAGWFLATCWLVAGFVPILFYRKKIIEPCTLRLPDPKHWPLVSVVVAARDESRLIEKSLGSLAALDYPSFEVIAVNDRSADGTGEIMDRLAKGESRIRAIHISELPKGWLGKCYALHQGAQQAAGELLLFTDADVTFAPQTLRLAVRYFEGHGLDHLVLFPGFLQRGYWEDALKAYFSVSFSLWTRAWAVSGPSKNIYIGVGAFNLVRRSAYDGIGGHESLRMEILDDITLGKRLKQEGYKQDALLASRHLELAWLEGVKGFVKGLEKNAFAGLQFSIAQLLLVTALIVFFIATPYMGALVFRDARIYGYLTAVLAMHAGFGIQASGHRDGWRVAPALPVVACIFLWTLWHSALVTLRQGGIRWRDTFYSLNDLKRRPIQQPKQK